jgi:hypothetical protein
LDPGFSEALAHLTPTSLVAPRAGTLKNLFVRHNDAVGNGNRVTYRVLVNGALTGISATVGTGAIDVGSDTTNTFAVAQGDIIDIKVMKDSFIFNGRVRATATIEVD